MIPPVIPPDALLSVTILADGQLMIWQPEARTTAQLADVLRTVADGLDADPIRVS